MSNLRPTLLEAHQAGRFLETVSGALSRNPNERKALASELATLHNERLINVFDAFTALKNNSNPGSDLFLVRNVFKEVLPDLEASAADVMQCALHLYQAAGAALGDGAMLDAFHEFCLKARSRPQEALVEIEAHPDLLADFLIAALISGSRTDTFLYEAEAIRLSQHSNSELRWRALLSLGRLHWQEGIPRTDFTLSTLERAAEFEIDDHALASTIKSAFELLCRDNANEARHVGAIANALSRGGERTLEAGSGVFAFHTNELSPALLQVLLDHLVHVKPSNKGALEKIDYGISNLIESAISERGLLLLEVILLAYPDDLSLRNFESASRAIHDNAKLRSKVLTRWLLRGAPSLCEGLDIIVDPHLDDPIELEIDTSELILSEPMQLVFVARKAIGYLFLRPISVASFLISLMRSSTDDDIIKVLGTLLFDPLLVNFPGKLKDYVAQRSTESGTVRTTLEESLRVLEAYQEGLKSAGDTSALHPSEAHREAYYRNFSQTVEESFKAAQAESVFLQLVSRSVILYGHKSVNYVYGAEGEAHRMEIQLQSHGTEFEFPRMTSLDPHGLDFMLRVFRFERIAA